MKILLIIFSLISICSCSDGIRQQEAVERPIRFLDSHKIVKDLRTNIYFIMSDLNSDVRLEMSNSIQILFDNVEYHLQKGTYSIIKNNIVVLKISDDGIFIKGNKVNPSGFVIVNSDGTTQISQEIK